MKYRGVMRTTAGTIRWKYKTDANADGVLEPSDGFLAFFDDEDFTYLPQEPSYVQLTAPADLAVGEPFDLAIVAFDVFANEANDSVPPVLSLSSDATFPSNTKTLDLACLANQSCPAGVLAVSGHPSIAVISGLSYSTPGFHKITATANAAGGPIPVYTHYAYVHAQTPVYRRFFGDTHFHTGSGTGQQWGGFRGDHIGNYTDAAQAYEYVYRVARLDFAALSDTTIGTDFHQIPTVAMSPSSRVRIGWLGSRFFPPTGQESDTVLLADFDFDSFPPSPIPAPNKGTGQSNPSVGSRQ
jgi:hypothetical protein